MKYSKQKKVSLQRQKGFLHLPSSKRGKTLWLIALVVLILIPTFFIVLFAYSKLRSGSIGPPLIPRLTEAPSSSSQKTNWKTYTNTQYRFSISYPPDWNLLEYPNDFHINGSAVPTLPNGQVEYIYIVPNNSPLATTDFKDYSYICYPGMLMTFNTGGTRVMYGIKYEMSKIGGVDARVADGGTAQEECDGSFVNVHTTDWTFDKNNIQYSINTNNGKDNNAESNQIIKSILSTFKFTN